VPGAERARRAWGTPKARDQRVRRGGGAPAGPLTEGEAATVLRHAGASDAIVGPRACGRNPAEDRGRAAAGACRAPPHVAVRAGWGVRGVEPG